MQNFQERRKHRAVFSYKFMWCFEVLWHWSQVAIQNFLISFINIENEQVIRNILHEVILFNITRDIYVKYVSDITCKCQAMKSGRWNRTDLQYFAVANFFIRYINTFVIETLNALMKIKTSCFSFLVSRHYG